MDAQGRFVATLIDASAKALAAGAVVRWGESVGEDEVQRWGFQRLAADAEVRLQSLAESLAAGRPELFALEVGWLSETYAAREMPVEFLEQSLRCLREELAECLPTDAAELACAYVDAARNGHTEARGGAAPNLDGGATPNLEDESPLAEVTRKFLLAVLEGRRSDAERVVLEAFEDGASVADLHTHVIGPAQAEMGRMWQFGEVHVAEEHLGSRIVQDVLRTLRSRAPRAEENGRSVLVASVPGNLHDIGASMVSDHFEMAGWRALFLGADTPAADLVLAVGDFGVDLLALSAGLGRNLRATGAIVAEVRQAHPRVPILVGGRPFAVLPDLWRTVGADGSAPDAASAVQVAEELLQKKG